MPTADPDGSAAEPATRFPMYRHPALNPDGLPLTAVHSIGRSRGGLKPTDSCSPPTTAPEVLVIEATGTQHRGGHESGPVADSSLADKDPAPLSENPEGPAPDPAPHSQVTLPTELNNSHVK